MNLSEPLAIYGLNGANVARLRGGFINAVYKIEPFSGESLVLKRYRASDPLAERLRHLCSVQTQLREAGLPIPRLVSTPSGEPFAVVAGQCFVLSQFVVGNRYFKSRMPSRAAIALGAAHARLLDALGRLPAQSNVSLPNLATIEARLRSLLGKGSPSRTRSARAEQACISIEQRLRMLDAWRGAPPSIEPQWTHGDFTHRNVLFDAGDEVTAILDFDNLRISDRARDVMRCFTLSFSHGSRGALEYFRGYVLASGIDVAAARHYVRIYHYMSLLDTWPADVLFENPGAYRNHWDQFLKPRPPSWEAGWDALEDRLAEIAAQCRAN